MLKLLNPKCFLQLSRQILPYLIIIFIVIFSYGIYLSLFNSPIDYQQGELVRIMYIHVPSAWLAVIIYTLIALCSFGSIVWKIRMLYIIAISAAPVGCCFTAITLITGSIWGQMTWGTLWVWDARLTSTLILLLLYLSYIIVVNAGDNILRCEKPAAVTSLIGIINIPIIKFSVNIWSTLHQQSSVFKIGGPTIHVLMLKPLIIMFIAFVIYFIIVIICRVNILFTKLKLFNSISFR
ncbi:heme exporter CcmC family protein [Orientia chuto str. Dubai]|uniref:Heme exporter protein C n=1 Tax=Orientia chuto str. Dubai TaxID=1359168 RepID=A0A0F3MN58_9RICK|nr:heme ABC transporter permease CcmC [Candidatus Orientia mediorientalis]KJV57081.1 heme exporter CcmC family protein [Orientia chuto str. Dubai]